MSDDLAPQPATLTSADGIALGALVTAVPNPVAAAAIAHPHPLYGGDMRNAVVAAMATAFAAAGVATVRANFRGVGASGGTHGGGGPERGDHAAALAAAHALAPDRPLYGCGYSFGADVALCSDHPALTMWIVVAPPLSLFADDAYVAATDERPKHLIVAAHDQFAPPDAVRAGTGGWRNVHVHVVDMADHFLAGATTRVGELVAEVLTAER